MKESRLQINPTCHLELVDWDGAFPSTCTLEYTEHSTDHWHSDNATTTDISPEKARGIINFLIPFAQMGGWLQVGPFILSRTPGKLHIRCGEGEGGEMPEEDFLKMVEQYYLAHF